MRCHFNSSRRRAFKALDKKFLQQYSYSPFNRERLNDTILINKIEVEYLEEGEYPTLKFFVKDQKNYDKVMKHIYTICPGMYWGGVKIVDPAEDEDRIP